MGSSPSKRSDQVEEIKKDKPEPVEKWAEHVDRSKPEDIKEVIPKKGGGKHNAKVVPTSDVVTPKGGKLKLTEGVIQDYINIEKAINRLERKNVLKKFESQTIYADNLKNTVEQLEAVLKELKKQTWEDFPSNQTDNLNCVVMREQDKMLETGSKRVSLAMFKWANGRVLLVHALTQFDIWNQSMRVCKPFDFRNERGRYFAAAEARNNFVAAAQNVQSCRMYLNKVDFPYGTEKEIAHMEDTVNKAFRTVDNDSEMKKALKVFQETQQKVASLIQWFDKVINDTIRKDLDQANNELIKKQKALREERLTLMKKLAKAQLDVDMKIDYDDVADDELERELKDLERQALRDVEKLKEADVQGILDLSKQGGNVVTPLNKLAPLPSKDALFGDVKQKLDEYDETRKQFERRNNLQREKQAMALQEKLKLRQQKNRRNRKERRDSIGAPPVEPTPKAGKKKSAHH
ncbi:hypothetical protein CAEBREN_19161 [Caenorhabditis brenneri]|uniref:Uncharacterized protein n=1 Tax=Caenorhabditis brenneri TaxID=135651 RepID=G0NUF4_CAEBE|nr:hypothetical protein CAEBREN_19161 [Caenorhabditis brenneri]